MAEIIPIDNARLGAAPEEWQHWDVVLGLTADLLPVVSNAKATISPESKLQALGKTPSRYNGNRHAAGIAGWTTYQAGPADIATWSRERDYGICLQIRTVRAIDVDVPYADEADAIREILCQHVEDVPTRMRVDSEKFLCLVELPGDYAKRRIKTAHGMIEFLATGQQCVVAGTHPGGARYQWLDGPPDRIPALTPAQFEDLWIGLAREFGIEDPTESAPSVKGAKLSEAVSSDPVARFLLDKGLVHRTDRDGKLHITCPWESEHTSGEAGDTSTTYWPAHTGGYAEGHFRCLHAHCEHRTDDAFRDAVGYSDPDDIQAIVDIAQPTTDAPKLPRFYVHPAAQFSEGAPLDWLIRGVIPRAELVVMYGEPGSGKSFLALDMAVAVATGSPWREKKVRQGRVVYVAAEGATGFRKRLHATAEDRGLSLADLPLGVIADAPDLMQSADATAIARALAAAGGADLIVIDTFARVMPGANENSGEDVGKVLKHCKGIAQAFGAVVLMVHHSGKDASKGARGWSGLRGAADTELEVVRSDAARSVTVSKQKDGEDGAEFAFKLETVVLGLDAEGEEISTCVVRHTEDKPVKRSERGPKGSVERLVLDVMRDVIPLGSEWVEVLDVKAKAKEQMPFDPAEGRRDTRGQRLDRAIDHLREAKRIVVQGTKLGFCEGNL